MWNLLGDSYDGEKDPYFYAGLAMASLALALMIWALTPWSPLA